MTILWTIIASSIFKYITVIIGIFAIIYFRIDSSEKINQDISGITQEIAQEEIAQNEIPVEIAQKEISLEEPSIKKNVEKHSDIQKDGDKVIVYFKGNRYDVTDFLKYHPGGKSVLVENNGRDVEELMEENNHSQYAYQTIEKYLIK